MDSLVFQVSRQLAAACPTAVASGTTSGLGILQVHDSSAYGLPMPPVLTLSYGATRREDLQRRNRWHVCYRVRNLVFASGEPDHVQQDVGVELRLQLHQTVY